MSSTDSPDQNASPATIVNYYATHYTRELAALYVIGVGLGLLAFFVSGLRIALRAASGGHGWLPTTAFVGALLYIGGFAVDGLIHFAPIEAGYRRPPGRRSPTGPRRRGRFRARFRGRPQATDPEALERHGRLLRVRVSCPEGRCVPRW